MARTLTDKLGLPQIPDGDTGWADLLNARLAALDARLGDFAVRETDIDTDTGLATSRRYTVAGGYYLGDQSFPLASTPTASAGTTGVAAAGLTTYLWLNPDGTFGFDTGGYVSTDAYAPLARVVCDSTKIVHVVDDRARVLFVGGTDPAAGFLATGATASTTYSASTTVAVAAGFTRYVYRFDCSAGPLTCTLPAISSTIYGAEVWVKKSDGTANALTVQSSGGDPIDGGTSKSTTTAYGVVKLYCRGLPTGWDTL